MDRIGCLILWYMILLYQKLLFFCYFYLQFTYEIRINQTNFTEETILEKKLDVLKF